MLPILSSYLTGSFAIYGKGVGLKQTTMSSSLAEQMDNGQLKKHIADFAQFNRLEKSKSQASVWHMHYTLQTLPSILVAHSVLERPLPLSMDQVIWQNELQQLQLPHQGIQLTGSDAETRYFDMIFNHFLPLHLWLQAHFSISSQVLWSNCAFRIEQFFYAIMQVLGQTPHLLHDQTCLLSQPTFRGQPNPLCMKPIEITHAGESYRLRNRCCLLHEVPQRAHCSDCPKLPAHIAHYSANR